jgi:hypothetical protein
MVAETVKEGAWIANTGPKVALSSTSALFKDDVS